MSATNKTRGTRKLFFLLALFVAMGISYYRLNGAFDGYFKAQIEAQLPKLRGLYGLAINYGSVDFGLISGPKIRDVTITTSHPGDIGYVLRIPEITIDYSIQYRPAFKVSIDAVELRRPSISLVSEFSAIRGYLGKFIGKSKQDSDVVVSNGHTLLQAMHLRWIDGSVDVRVDEMGGGDSSFQLKVKNVDGLAKYDPRARMFVVENLAELDGDGGYFGLMATNDKSGEDLTVFLKRIKLNKLAKYLPESIKVDEKSYVDAKIKAKSIRNIPAKPVNMDLQLKGLILHDESVAKHAIGGIDLSIGGDIALNFQDKEIEIDKLSLGIKKLSLNITGIVDYKEKLKIDGVISIDDAPIQSILDSMPKDFIPTISGTKIAGTLGYEMEFSLDFNKLSSFKLEPRFDIKDYRLLKTPKGVDIEKLKGNFKHTVRRDGESVKDITVGRSSKKYVPFRDLGEYTIKGVLTCEDGSFFYHNGFQLKHIRESIIQNIRDKQFTRGASTITMQLAKNLFLSGEKNLSRKFQEMLIAYALEQELDKKRILEIYMNVIEWGPDLYGIGPAAKHYFDKEPEELTALESAYLGSIIASPKRYHYMYKNGYVTDPWITYLSIILRKMNIMVEEYEDARPFEPEFGWVRKEREAREARESTEGQDDNSNL